MKKTGFIGRLFLIFCAVLTLCALGGTFVWKSYAKSAVESPPLTVKANIEKFVHELTDRGNVDSQEGSAEVLCEVETGGELTVLSIVPEGSIVKEGDMLIELDSTNLQESHTKQQLAVNSSLASVVQCESDLKTADLSFNEYVEGKFPESLMNLQNKKFTAEEEMRTAEENVRFNIRLLQKGYITESQAESDITAYKKAQNNFNAAEKEIWVLENYTKEKTVEQNRATIETTKAKLASARQNLLLDQNRLNFFQKQIERCTIRSPQDGQVVYVNDNYRRDEYVLKEGAKVYGRQRLIKLPDSSKMEINAIINEAKVRLVKPGLNALIELEAFPNQIYKGTVKTVSDYPEPAWGSTSMSREYKSKIQFVEPPIGIKPGLTAKVKIIVEEIPEALVVPVQSVFEHGGIVYALEFNAGQWNKKIVKTGATNDKVVVITDGLSEGDEIVLGAWQYREKVDLPKEVKKKSERPEKTEAALNK